jgi:hypothetical protein
MLVLVPSILADPRPGPGPGPGSIPSPSLCLPLAHTQTHTLTHNTRWSDLLATAAGCWLVATACWLLLTTVPPTDRCCNASPPPLSLSWECPVGGDGSGSLGLRSMAAWLPVPLSWANWQTHTTELKKYTMTRTDYWPGIAPIET